MRVSVSAHYDCVHSETVDWTVRECLHTVTERVCLHTVRVRVSVVRVTVT